MHFCVVHFLNAVSRQANTFCRNSLNGNAGCLFGWWLMAGAGLF
jgi:hypothetical protein